ncbi:hypothetical protein JW911_01820 [Candidatus Peregrinibacteria bacterium]|nr:hypothetical protein [Candidatus Peregrinibacteria bacterium]
MFKKTLTICLLIYTALFSFSYIAYAQRGIDPSLKPEYAPDVPAAGPGEQECKDLGGQWDKTAQICTGYEAEPINAFLQVIGGALLMLSGGIAVIVVTVGGILYISSRGNQQQLELAKNTLVYGVLGMVVIIFSYFIVRFVLTAVTGN